MGGLFRHVVIFNIRSQWQDPEIMIFCYKSILWKIRSHAETQCAQDIARLKDIAEKQVPAKLKQIVDSNATIMPQ